MKKLAVRISVVAGGLIASHRCRRCRLGPGANPYGGTYPALQAGPAAADIWGRMSPFPRQLAWFTAGIFSAALAAALILLFREGPPRLATLVVFGLAHRVLGATPGQLRKRRLRVALPRSSAWPRSSCSPPSTRSSARRSSCSLAGLRFSDLRRGRLRMDALQRRALIPRLPRRGRSRCRCCTCHITSTPLGVLAMIPAAAAYIARRVVAHRPLVHVRRDAPPS